MTTNTEPGPEQGFTGPSSTPEKLIPSQPSLGDSKTLRASDTPFAPSITAEATATLAPTTTELEQASISSTLASRASSARDLQNNDDGDSQQGNSASDEKPDSENNDADASNDDNDMYGDDVIVPVELTVLPDSILEAIPDEVWCLLLSFVPPAKLITLTRVCRRWKLMIERDLVASYWKVLTVQAELLDHSLSPDLDVDSKHAEMPIGFIKTFPELVLGHTLVICELCLMRSKRGCGSAIPLPVDRQDTLGRVWMCRPCRRDYYDRYPEPERVYKAEDQVSLYGLPGHPPKVARSTGPPAPRRPYYYPREHWGGGGRYYGGSDSSDEFNEFDEFDEFDSTDDEYWDSDGDLYFATEADLEEDELWSREADAREAAAEEAAQVLMGVIQGDTKDDGQRVQDSGATEGGQVGQGDESSSATIDGKPAWDEQPEIQEATATEGSLVGQSSDIRCTSVDGGYDADGEPVIKSATTGFEAELEDEQGMDDEDEGEGDEVEEEDEVGEEDGEMSYDESDRSGDGEEEEEEEVETKETQTPANQSIVQEARRHHGGDIGIQAHSSSNIQLRERLQPLRNRLMQTRLRLLGLQLRNDSKLCQDYLNGLRDDPFKIADVMKQMQWYFSGTAYSSYIEDSDSSTAKSAAMEEWIEDSIAKHGENAKKAYRGLGEDQDLEDAVVNVMDPKQPPKSLWGVLDLWIDHRLKGDQGYSPALETFAVVVATDDLQD
ncbi:hypothetical protein KI688_011256 [Linnemannia hyalina]|uniref:F-box domain-containing protein n=1 Tax=Linnemannia hyalina TaxID=64524 RepID=A0A9P7XUK0_9FUNG|nr:hypothetical protein KI688_011256 [Linnemannia hyalina]